MAIDALINEYRRAYEAMDLNRLKAVFPSLPNPSAVQEAFDDATAVLVGMGQLKITVTSAASATVETMLAHNFTPKVGTARNAGQRKATFTLRKEGGRWTIVSLKM